MFDARSILEGLVRGAGPLPGQAPGQSQSSPGQGGGGLGDILGQILNGANGAGSQPGYSNATRQTGPGQGGSDQGLSDILSQFQEKLGTGGATDGKGGNLLDVLGQVLGQATDGVREGAGRIDQATGASDALGRATGGRSPEDLLNQLKDFIRTNPVAAGTAAAGLGGLLLGTRAGRSLAAGAARAGALALIGGLAYKALQNYQAGKPLISGDTQVEAAPRGSGFEPSAVSNDDAILYIRAMVAAAAADGRIDSAEQQKIIGSLGQAGLDAEAEAFLANLLNNPPTIADLVRDVRNREQAAQVYTAARIAIDINDIREAGFLGDLANALNLDPDLVAHIDATARAAT